MLRRVESRFDNNNENPMSGLTAEQTDEIKAAFALLDSGNGTITSSETVIAMKSLGQGTPALWQKAKQQADANGGAVSQTYFLTLMSSPVPPFKTPLLLLISQSHIDVMANDNIEDLLAAFRCLDKRDEGTIDVESFRRVMQNLGTAKLNSREVDAMLEVGGLEGNRLRYADWVKAMLQ